MTPEIELAAVVAHLQGMMLSREAATAAVEHLARVARDLSGPAAGAGVSLLENTEGRVTTAATDPVVEAADMAQYDLDEGPCLSAWATGALQRLEDTATDTRWPAFSAALAPLGVGSMLSVPLVFAGRTLGTLKVYARAAHAFSVHDETLLIELATAAATLLAAGQEPEAPQQLGTTVQATLAERHTIAVATGILMERHRLGHDEARQLLLESARTGGRPVAEHARRLLERPTDPHEG